MSIATDADLQRRETCARAALEARGMVLQRSATQDARAANFRRYRLASPDGRVIDGGDAFAFAMTLADVEGWLATIEAVERWVDRLPDARARAVLAGLKRLRRRRRAA